MPCVLPLHRSVWLLALGASLLVPPLHAATPGPEDGGVPVVVAEVRRQEMDLYLNGLGKVQALNTVLVRPQVDGRIMQIAFQDGQEVRQGDLLAQIDDRPYQAALDQAVAKQAQDQAQLEYAGKVLERYTALRSQGSIDQQTYDLQKATVDQWQAQVHADAAAAGKARVDLEYTRITAPMNGRLGFRLVDAGNTVHASDAGGVAVITQVQPIAVVFTLPERDVGAIRGAIAGSPAPLPVLVADRDNERTLATGTLSALDNQIEEGSGTIRLKALFANNPPVLWPGQFVNVRLRLARRTDGLVVPGSAVQNSPDGTFVYVVSADSTVALRPVTVGFTEDGLTVIEKGLAPGEQVVTDGHYLLQPKMRVRIKK